MIALLAAVASLLAPDAARAAESELRLPDGRVLFERGQLRLEIGGGEAWSRRIKGAPEPARTEMAAHALAGGVTAVDVRLVDAAGNDVFEIVALREGAARSLRVVWSGAVSAAGDPGERARTAVRFEDLTSDGAPEILLGTEFEPVRVCGRGEPPLLFRRAYDPGQGRLRQILAKRPGLTPTADLDGAAGPADTRPVVPIAAAASASRNAGDRGDTLLLAPPYALVDGDPATVWSPGLGASSGEFATLSAAAEQYGVVRVGIVLPAASARPAWARPRSLLLVTASEVYRLRFPEGASAAAGAVWFDLPAPARTPCLTIVAEQAEGARGDAQLALADVVVLTELDAAGGLARLVRDLDDAAKGGGAAALLLRAGAAALPPLREAWVKLGEDGRRRAARVVADAMPAAGADLLAEAAVGADGFAAAAARAGLARAPAEGAAALGRFLSSVDARKLAAAVEALADLAVPPALDLLVGAAGEGSRSQRARLRAALTRLAGRGPDLAERLSAAIDAAAKEADAERLFDLLRASAAAAVAPERTAAVAITAYESATRFPDRHRALEVVAACRVAAATPTLLAAFRDDDARIRAVAIAALAPLAESDAAAAEALRAALADPEVPVRLAGLAGLRGFAAPAAAGPGLTAIARADPWPAVRAAVARLAGELPGAAALEILSIAFADASAQVRLAGLESAPRVAGAQVDRLVVDRLTTAGEEPRVRAAAARAARARCQISAVEPLYELLRRGAEPLAELRDVDAAVEAAGALGAIGGARSEELLRRARQRSNPSTDKAIDAALERLGAECGTRAATAAKR